jgi:RNA polymerase sigma-70 factor (ECF subfamily)
MLVAEYCKKLKNLNLPTPPSGYIMMSIMGNSSEKIKLEEIFVKYKSIVSFRVKKSLGAFNPDSDDVANEIITNVVEKIKKGEFRGESSIGTFIYTITSRRIVDYIRQKSKVLKHVPEPSSYPDPQEQIENQERAEMIAIAIKKLKPKYREVLYLYYYKDLSREEVAEKLGISPRRVSERVNYSQKLLKKLIKT